MPLALPETGISGKMNEQICKINVNGQGDQIKYMYVGFFPLKETSEEFSLGCVKQFGDVCCFLCKTHRDLLDR